MTRYVRVVLRQHRFEVRAFAVIGAIALALALALTVAVASLDIGPCLANGGTDGRCVSAGDTWALLQVPAMVLGYGSAAFIAFAGLVFGVQLVAKELEHRTALIAWTLAPSRSRWFVERAVIMGAFVLGLAALLGLALDLLHAVSYPLAPLGASLAEYQSRGWMLVAYAAVAFGVGALCGAVIGRGLPAMIIALVSASLLLGGILAMGDAVAKSNPVAIESRDLGALVADYMVQDVQDGRLLTFEEAGAIVPQTDPGFADRFAPVRAGVPGDRSLIVIGMQVVVCLGSAIALLVAAAAVVARRRTA